MSEAVSSCQLKLWKGKICKSSYQILKKKEPNAVILSVISPFAEKRAQKILNALPPSLDELYDQQKFQHSSLEELRQFVLTDITEEEQITIERATIEQSSSNL